VASARPPTPSEPRLRPGWQAGSSRTAAAKQKSIGGSPSRSAGGPNGEYIVSFEGYSFVIPANKALPSNDPCSHIFLPNMWMVTDDGNQLRDPRTPDIRCFLTPLDF
jgi:hypothetical protein